MKLITKTILILYLLLIPAQSETNKLVVYTYDSFVAEWGPGPALEAKFEEFCMCDLQFVGLSDGVEILTRVMYEGQNTNADIVLGLDSNLTHKAKMTGMFDNHSLDLQNLNISDRFEDEVFVPYDFGYFSFIYNSSKIQNPPTSFDELLNSKISIIIQDPRTSTPGLGLLLWIKKSLWR
jgi:thiamine transport system substrate-binding protein